MLWLLPISGPSGDGLQWGIAEQKKPEAERIALSFQVPASVSWKQTKHINVCTHEPFTAKNYQASINSAPRKIQNAQTLLEINVSHHVSGTCLKFIPSKSRKKHLADIWPRCLLNMTTCRRLNILMWMRCLRQLVPAPAHLRPAPRCVKPVVTSPCGFPQFFHVPRDSIKVSRE